LRGAAGAGRIPPPDSEPSSAFDRSMQSSDAIVVMTTLASEAEAVTLVKALLERRLIACGTIIPAARSLYRWDGKIADETEVLVMLKTRSARIEALEMAFDELHPYKVPELLALPVTAGNAKYLNWIGAETVLGIG
jgi:periplasmic divalent cation tolerance protein